MALSIRYKKDKMTVDVINDGGQLRVKVDGKEYPVHERMTRGSVTRLVYIPQARHNKQLTIPKVIVNAVMSEEG